MSREHRKTSNGTGFVYILTNSLYEKENHYKYGYTINPYQRTVIQSNIAPPDYPLYYKLLILSPNFKEIEKWFEKQTEEKGFRLYGEKGGTEWVKADFNEIYNLYVEVLKTFPKSKLCCNGKCYEYKKGKITEVRFPNCRLDLLGIVNDDLIKCVKDDKSYKVKDNKIIVEGKEMTLSAYMNLSHKREGKTNQHNGFQYFTYKNKIIYDLWQELFFNKKK